MNCDGPSKCVYLEGEDVAANVDEEAVRDEGTSKRKRYGNTSRPVGVPAKVWKRHIKPDHFRCIGLIHALLRFTQ
eukprot:15218679-Heterocapsa_arctica.AAC.1